MKLKQALVIGLSSAILAIPAFAAGTASVTTLLPTDNTNQPAAVVTPAKKEARHRKCHKKVSLERKTDEQAKQNAKLDELNTLNSAAEKDQTEKNSIKS